MTVLTIIEAGPGLTVQDLGRPGHTATGLSRGGAADRLALLEAAALLGGEVTAGIEMAGLGGLFTVSGPARIALTGAPMKAELDGQPLRWNATHRVNQGQRLRIGGATAGSYGYLSVGGGLATEVILGSRSAHLAARIGRILAAGDELPVDRDPLPNAPSVKLDPEPRFQGGEVRLIEGPQTRLFPKDVRDRLTATAFRRAAQGNRQGVRLDLDGSPLGVEGGLTVVSDLIVPGDIQMTGDGVPFVLLAECQTIGGYPRIGTVIPADLPRVAQAAPGAPLRFRWVTLDEADRACRPEAAELADLRRRVQPLVRDPHDIADLLSYQLIGGVTAGDDT